MDAPVATSQRRLGPTAEGHDLVVIGASAGGISAITTLLAGLPADLPAAVLIVLHVAADSGTMLPGIFGAASPLPVALAEDACRCRRARSASRRRTGTCSSSPA